MSDPNEQDAREAAKAAREHEREALEHSDAERAPAGEDEPGDADVTPPEELDPDRAAPPGEAGRGTVSGS